MNLSEFISPAQLENLPGPVAQQAEALVKQWKQSSASEERREWIQRQLSYLGEFPWIRPDLPPLEPETLIARLDSHVYGLTRAKQTLARLFTGAAAQAAPFTLPVFTGPRGTGKEALARALSAATRRPLLELDIKKIYRGSLGGCGDDQQEPPQPGILTQILRQNLQGSPLIFLKNFSALRPDEHAGILEELSCIFRTPGGGRFCDPYLGIPYSLKGVHFLAACADAEHIAGTLRPWVTPIYLPGYFIQDKIEIFHRHIAPRLNESENPPQREWTPQALDFLIRRYAPEAGLHQLMHWTAYLQHSGPAKNSGVPGPNLAWEPESVRQAMPLAPRTAPPYRGPKTWVALGAAHHSQGGEIFPIQCKIMSGRGRTHITGNGGPLLTEACQIARALVRERLKRYGLGPEIDNKTDVYLHFAPLRIPKEGPSLGLPVALVMLSAFRRKPLGAGTMFTGELDLAGNILPVGGLMPKLIAAEQCDLRRVFIPAPNITEPDFDLPPYSLSFEIKSPAHLDEVIAQCLD